MEKPWNWCHKCRQPVDAVLGEFSDGGEERCWGCNRLFVATAYTDGTWTLTVVRERARRTRREG